MPPVSTVSRAVSWPSPWPSSRWTGQVSPSGWRSWVVLYRSVSTLTVASRRSTAWAWRASSTWKVRRSSPAGVHLTSVKSRSMWHSPSSLSSPASMIWE